MSNVLKEFCNEINNMETRNEYLEYIVGLLEIRACENYALFKNKSNLYKKLGNIEASLILSKTVINIHELYSMGKLTKSEYEFCLVALPPEIKNM